MDETLAALDSGNLDAAKRLFKEVFHGTMAGRSTDPGMAGSLLYHMAMVTKMSTETRFLLAFLGLKIPKVDVALSRFYGDFCSDVQEFGAPFGKLKLPARKALEESLSTEKKIALFNNLAERTRDLEARFPGAPAGLHERLDTLFMDWANSVAEMRLRQEYETIKGLLITSQIAHQIGLKKIEKAMATVRDGFGEETVNIALNVTLQVGMRREKLQSIMLSDHFIHYAMNSETLDGSMEFLNCPIYGSYKYLAEKSAVTEQVASLFCKHFCYAHAKAMLETVLPFTLTLSQPKRMSTHGKCQFYLKLGRSPETPISERFFPLVVSWNVTRKCNLSCSHCYINANQGETCDELTTDEAKHLIDQISEVSRPLLILSGGEPLLRGDVFELITHGAKKGLKMGLGSNGTLIDDSVAKDLKAAGAKTVSISLDSSVARNHDDFRGTVGSWSKAIRAITALKQNGLLVQVNTTVTQQNKNEIDEIMSTVEQLGVENFHLFFLVPTGRGAKIADISPATYESMITTAFAKTAKHRLNVKPSCAPQFMRIAKDMGLDMRQWIRGCIAGLYYCRIYPNGDVTPCPYLPVKLGNVRETSFREIWFGSDVFKNLRNFDNLKGKCGACNYRDVCGGCRARAYGLSSDFLDYCGDLQKPGKLRGDYLTEDPWCVYQPSLTKKDSE